MVENIGTTLGPYKLTRRLARGGMSEVYLAHTEESSQRYALKVVRLSNIEHHSRFQQELQAQRILIHPHIVPILDYGEENDFCYYVMPYIQHGTLRERIAQGPMESAETGEILAQLADALQFMHDRGIVHRDVKPGNILVDEENQIWLADFGLVKEFEAGSDLTDTGSLIGTPFYMAPELVDRPASPSSDIYALGIVLYEMLTGRVPFKGKSPVAVCWQHMYDRPPWPSSFNPAITPALEKVIMHALAKKPAGRFARVSGLAEAYQKALTTAVFDEVEEDEEELEDLGPITINIKPISTIKALRQRHHSRPRSLAAASVAVVLIFSLGAVSLGMIYGAGSPAIAGKAAQVASIQNASTLATPEGPVQSVVLTPVPQPKSAATQTHPSVKAQPKPVPAPPTTQNKPVKQRGGDHRPEKRPVRPSRRPEPPKLLKPVRIHWPWPW